MTLSWENQRVPSDGCDIQVLLANVVFAIPNGIGWEILPAPVIVVRLFAWIPPHICSNDRNSLFPRHAL